MCTWLPKDADDLFISKCVFYLRRADINVVWPSAFPAETVLELVTSEPVAATEVPKHTEAAPAAELLKPPEPEFTQPLKLVETTPITDQAAQLQKAKRAGRPSSKKLVLLKVEERALEHRRRLAGGEPPSQTDGLPEKRDVLLKEVSDWLRETHPGANPMQPKTIGDHLRTSEPIRALLPKKWFRRR